VKTMKRIAYFWLTGAVLACLLATLAGAQSESLGDYARQARKQKTSKPAAAKQFDNDNLPKNDKLSVVGEARQEAAAVSSDGEAQEAATEAPEGESGAAAQPEQKDQAAEQKPDGKPGESPEDRQKFFEDWKQKISQQQDQIALLTRELDVAQKEYQLRAAAFYADAGNRLRNSGNWDKEDAQYKQQIADKQKALDAAKQKLDDMQEEARKSGVPSSVREQ
jgi:hypothetical protein